MTRIAVTRAWMFEGLTQWQATCLEWWLPQYIACQEWQ